MLLVNKTKNQNSKHLLRSKIFFMTFTCTCAWHALNSSSGGGSEYDAT